MNPSVVLICSDEDEENSDEEEQSEYDTDYSESDDDDEEYVVDNSNEEEEECFDDCEDNEVRIHQGIYKYIWILLCSSIFNTHCLSSNSITYQLLC